jgi:hypothetical protein
VEHLRRASFVSSLGHVRIAAAEDCAIVW